MQKGLIVHTLISNDQGEVLLLQRSKSNDVLPEYWDIPGGTLEDGEDPAAGAVREAKEETGLDISDLRLFFHKSNVDTKKDKQFVTLIFHAKSSQTDVTPNPGEHDAYKWVEIARTGPFKTVGYLPDCLRAYTELITRQLT